MTELSKDEMVEQEKRVVEFDIVSDSVSYCVFYLCLFSDMDGLDTCLSLNFRVSIIKKQSVLTHCNILSFREVLPIQTRK